MGGGYKNVESNVKCAVKIQKNRINKYGYIIIVAVVLVVVFRKKTRNCLCVGIF